jgi:hypothetical protein
MNTTTANVRTDLLDELAKRIERKINRPARKLKLPEAVVEFGEPFPRFYAREKSTIGFEGGYTWFELDDAAKARREERGDRVWVFEFTPVTITAAEPKLNGWKFIATVEHTEAGNILRSATDDNQNLPTQYRSTKNVCDHCQTNRRRKDTYIVRHDSFGEYRQVGRNCVADFLGHGDPAAVARYFDNILSLWSDLDERPDDESFCRAPETETTEIFLAVAAESVRVNGWVAKSSWDGYPTATLAWDYLFTILPPGNKRVERYGFDSISDESRELAKAAREWAANLDVSETDASDYLYNLKVACSLELVTGRRTGIVASAISAYQRHLGDVAYKKVEKKRKAEASPVPVTDERFEITGEVISAKWRQTDFGSSLKLTIQTEDGYRVWGSAPASLLRDGDTQPGDVVTFTAKVVVSDDDKTFGFYKRPTKASYVSRAADAAEEEAAA